MYGFTRRIKAARGQRDLVAAILFQGSQNMPGCQRYVVAHDPDDEDALWVTEIWDSPESHWASLSLPAVKRAMLRGKPFIAELGERFELEPAGAREI